jgi:exodeoxyribonuclease VII small subunit
MARDDSPKKEAPASAQPSNHAPDAAGQAPQSFESGLQQLEAIVKEMESGDLPLERALQLFESGMKLSETCRRQLEAAETRVEILMKRAGSAAGEDSMQARPFRPEK